MRVEELTYDCLKISVNTKYYLILTYKLQRLLSLERVLDFLKDARFWASFFASITFKNQKNKEIRRKLFKGCDHGKRYD